MLVASQGWELLCMLLSLGAYVAYHVWLFAFDTSVPGRFKVQDVAKRGRRIWARAIAEKDSETVTGVQTLRWVAASLCLWAGNCSCAHDERRPYVQWHLSAYAVSAQMCTPTGQNWGSAASIHIFSSCLRSG